jgi:hypothetical protein
MECGGTEACVMGRPFPELIKDYDADPSNWEVVVTVREASTNMRNKGGTSVQDTLRHKTTGEEMVRHTVLEPDATVFHPPHFRPFRK